MHRLLFLSSLLLSIFCTSAQTVTTPLADSTKLPTLLIFSGSDWCLPCIRLEREIFSKPEFIEFAKGRIKILKADFPQRKKLDPKIVLRNESLAERYNPKGEFPLLVLLDANEKVKTNIPAEYTSLEYFIADLKNLLIGEPREYRKKALLMGSSFEFIVVANNSDGAEAILNQGKAEVERLENLLSEWRKGTEVSRLNNAVGKNAVKVSDEVYQLAQRSLALSNMTQGAFDISFNGMNIYKFDKSTITAFPDTALIEAKLKTVGFEKIKLQTDNHIFLSDSGMSIGFGASGKGFAADEVKKLWQERGVKSGVVNASGDLVAWGKRADGTPWKIGIADPEDITKVLFWIPVENQAVATSGSYEKYFKYNGQRYAHIVNPLTGFPVTDKKSVTVISPSGELSDALATALFVLDIEVGLDLIRQLPQAECIIIDSSNEVHFSNKLKLIN